MSYTNNLEAVTDGLRTILYAEFKPRHVELNPAFEPDKMTHGEYIRYWVLDSYAERYADGETRFYTVEVVLYFDMARRIQKTFDDVWSERIERLQQVLMDNSSYTPSDTYTWHNINIRVEPVEKMEDTEVYTARLELEIARGNNW